MPKKRLIDRHPWFPFVLAFFLLIGAWTSMIMIALKTLVRNVCWHGVSLSEACVLSRFTPVEHTMTKIGMRTAI